MIAKNVPVRLNQGAFVFSLDFELAWGTRGRQWSSIVGPDIDGTRNAISQLLALCQRYQISATWVVVGAMFMGGNQRHRWLRDEQFDDVPVGDCFSQPRWYAEDILKQLREATPEQDIGCHTLTHMFVQDSDESREKFDLELERSAELFEELGLPPATSFIFPKHYMAHFDLLAKHRFRCYRGPESGWFERLPTRHAKAAGRLFSARIRQTPSVTYPYLNDDGLWVIPSSQFYPSFRSVGKRVSVRDRVAKGIKGLNRAAKRKGVYHLWTHPFNLGVRTEELLSGFEEIFGHARKLEERGDLKNLSMASLASDLDGVHCLNG